MVQQHRSWDVHVSDGARAKVECHSRSALSASDGRQCMRRASISVKRYRSRQFSVSSSSELLDSSSTPYMSMWTPKHDTRLTRVSCGSRTRAPTRRRRGNFTVRHRALSAARGHLKRATLVVEAAVEALVELEARMTCHRDIQARAILRLGMLRKIW